MPLATLIAAIETKIPESDDQLAPIPTPTSVLCDDSDSQLTNPPLPPSSLQDDDLECWIAATQFIVDDGQESSLAPVPPISSQDDDLQRWTGLVSIVDDGQESSRTPLPPTAFQIDDDAQRWVSATTVLVDDGQESFLPPLPPLPQQGWDEIEAMYQSQPVVYVAMEEAEYGIVVPIGGASVFQPAVHLGCGVTHSVGSGNITVGGIG